MIEKLSEEDDANADVDVNEDTVLVVEVDLVT